jgi:hypothetical protein
LNVLLGLLIQHNIPVHRLFDKIADKAGTFE